MQEKPPWSRRKKLLIGGLILGVLFGWQLVIQPVFTCPYCEDWSKQVKAEFQPIPTCPLCGGQGRVTYFAKGVFEREWEKDRAGSRGGP